MAKENIQNKEHMSWMPIEDYKQWEKISDELSIETKNRMAYFFWNNFSYYEYEEWKFKQENNGK